MGKKNAESAQKDSSNLQDIRNVDLYVEFYGKKKKLFIYLCVLCLSVPERNRKTDRLHVGRTRLVCMHVCRHRVTQARVCKVCIWCVCVSDMCVEQKQKFTEVEVFKMF